jgi:hypothetical protein
MRKGNALDAVQDARSGAEREPPLGEPLSTAIAKATERVVDRQVTDAIAVRVL